MLGEFRRDGMPCVHQPQLHLRSGHRSTMRARFESTPESDCNCRAILSESLATRLA